MANNLNLIRKDKIYRKVTKIQFSKSQLINYLKGAWFSKTCFENILLKENPPFKEIEEINAQFSIFFFFINKGNVKYLIRV